MKGKTHGTGLDEHPVLSSTRVKPVQELFSCVAQPGLHTQSKMLLLPAALCDWAGHWVQIGAELDEYVPAGHC